MGYMDPGNRATDPAGGSRFGYPLLWVIPLSGMMAIFLLILSARRDIVAGMDLATAQTPSVVLPFLYRRVFFGDFLGAHPNRVSIAP